MKTFNFFEKLWEHGRTLRRVGLVLVMCLMAIPQVWASDPHFHLTGETPTGGWSNSGTEWKLSSPASSALSNGATFNEYCTYMWLSEGDYFGLNNGSKRYSRNDYYDIEIKEGSGSGVYGYPGDCNPAHDDKSFHYIGATGLVRINAAQTGSGNSYGNQGEYYPYIWIEESLETDILNGSKIMFYFGIADGWNTNWFYLSKEGDQNNNKSYKAYYSTATKLNTRIAVAYVDANTTYYIASAQSGGTCIKMASNAEAGNLYSLNSQGGNNIYVNVGNKPHFATTSVTKAKGTEASTIAATAANSIFGNAYTYHYYYTTDGGSTFTKFDPTDISDLASGTYTVYALGWDGHILVKSDNSVTLKITVPITLNANGGVDGAVTSVNAVNGDAASGGNIAGGSLPTKTNYVFTGFYTSGGTKVINADGEWISNVSGYTDASGNWTCTAGSTLYAHWEDQWNLKGSWDSWANYKGMTNVSSNTFEVTLSLSASTYDFKVVKRTRGSDDVYYGKSETTFTRSSLTSAKNLVTTGGETYNMHITTDVAGDYVFTYVYDADNDNMKVYVKYPCFTDPAGGTIFALTMGSGTGAQVRPPRASDASHPGLLDLISYGSIANGLVYAGNKATGSDKGGITSSGQIQLDGDEAFIKIQLDCPLETGDKIDVTTTEDVYVTTSSTRATTYNISKSATYVCPAAFNAASEIYLWKNSSNAKVTKITIERCSNPADPTAFSSSSVWATAAKFTITDAADAESYDLYYASGSPSAPTSGTTATENVTTKTPTITGLSASTTYKIWVRSVCDATHKSSWVVLSGNSFKTADFEITDAKKPSSGWSDRSTSATSITSSMIEGVITNGTVEYTGSGTLGCNATGGFVFDNNNDEITITVTGMTIPAGAVITINAKGTDSSSSHECGFTVGGNSMSPATTTSSTSQNSFTQTYTVVAKDGIAGNSSFTIARVSGKSKTYLESMAVSGCEEVSCTTSPTVTAASNSAVAVTTATVTCASGISSLGSAGCEISSYGFVLGTSSNPTTSNTTYEVGTTYTSTGVSFYKDLTSLVAGATYYVRPYATNANGTAYGTQTYFTTHYAITTGSHTNGSVTIPSSAASGATVNISATGDTGYDFTSWTIINTTTEADVTATLLGDNSETASTSFTMPSYGVTVNATFTVIDYAITHSAASNGSYTIQVASEDAVSTNTTANYGQTITLAASPDSHYKLQAWNVTKTSSGDAVSMATANTFVMPAEAVTIAPTFGRVYTVSFEKNGASSATPSPVEQSTVGGTVTMASAPTYSGYTFQGWMIGDAIYAAGDATYVPTADVKAWAIWKQDCAGGGSATLFSQNFNSATAVAYAKNTDRAYDKTTNTLSNLVGDGANLFTSITADGASDAGLAINSSTGKEIDATGIFQAYKKNSSEAYWSIVRTNDFAATAPTALKVEMDVWYAHIGSGSYAGVNFAIGNGFTDGLKTSSAQSASTVHSGFGITNESTPKMCVYDTYGTKIYNTAWTESTWMSITWIINNTGSDLTYDDPDGSGTTTLANDKYDIWLKTQAGATSTYTKVVSGQAATTASVDLQEIHIGSNSGSTNEFRLDNVVVTDLNAAGSCHYVTYDGNGATSGAVNDTKAYTSGDNSAYVLSSNFHREDCYEVSCWNTAADGSGTDYQAGDYITVNENITLYAQWRIIIDENTTDLTAYEDVKHKDVRVTNGATLTITQDTTVRNMLVETGSTLKIATTAGDAGVKLTVKNLALAGGYGTVNNAIKYDMPRVFINSKSTLTKANSTVNFDIAVTNQYHPIAVPFRVKVKDVNYAKKSLKDIAEYLTNYAIKTYNGKTRAEGGSSNWNPVYRSELVDAEWVDNYLEPGQGYILAAMRGYGDAFAVIRFPMEVDDAWTAGGEKGVATISAVETTKNAVSVTAWTKAVGETLPKNKGWNILGVPYMSCFASSEAGHDQDNPYVMGKLNFITGEYTETSYAYVNVPTHDFSEYIQEKVSDAVLLPGWCFFIQFDKTGTLTFATSGQEQTSSLPIYAPKYEQENMPIVETGIILSGNDASDKTTIIVSDRYTAAEYEINADLEKLFGDNGYSLATYSLSGETRLAYNAMSNADAANIIPIGYRAPADGEYTFSINPRYAENSAFESVNLIDYETGITTNLLLNSYSFSTERTQNDARFALNVTKRQDTTTDIENGATDANGVRKVLINKELYIILDGKMYDATGKAVK